MDRGSGDAGDAPAHDGPRRSGGARGSPSVVRGLARHAQALGFQTALVATTATPYHGIQTFPKQRTHRMRRTNRASEKSPMRSGVDTRNVTASQGSPPFRGDSEEFPTAGRVDTF